MSYGKSASNYKKPITVMTYDEYEDIRERMNARRKVRISRDRERRARYYSRQRLLGFAILFVGVLCLIAGCVLESKIPEYFGLAVSAFGLFVIVTKHTILIDKYYLELQDRFNEY